MAYNTPYGMANLQQNIDYAQMVTNPYNTLGMYQKMQPQVYTPMAQTPTATATPNSGGSGGGGSILGGIAQIGFGIGDIIKGNKARKKFEPMVEQELNAMPLYTESPYAARQLRESESMTNAINPAVAMLNRQNQLLAANTAAVGQRNAMSGAEAINAAAMGQQMASQQAPQIAQMQTQYEMANRNNLYSALQNMTGERTNVFNSKVAKNDRMYNHRLGQLGAANQRLAQGKTGIVSGVGSVESGAKGLIKPKM